MNSPSQYEETSIPMSLWCVGLGLLGAISIWMYQVFSFLRFGQWMPISVLTALSWLEVEWAIFPNQWLGVYKVLDFLPLSLVSIIFAAISGWVLNHSTSE